jgi:hypothetical protein
MVEIHLYGNLRSQVLNSLLAGESRLELGLEGSDTVESIISRLGVKPDQISTIFVNSKLFVTRSNKSKVYGYLQVGDDPLTWDLSLSVEDGDRIGIFGSDMPLIV